MARKVLRATFHDLNLVAPGIGSIVGNELPPKMKNVPGLQMEYDGMSLTVSVPGYNDFAVPSANLKAIFFDKEPTPAKK